KPGPASAIYTRAKMLGSVAARVPLRKIEIRRGSDLDDPQVISGDGICKTFCCREKSHGLLLRSCPDYEITRYASEVRIRSDRLAGHHPDAAALDIGNCALP